MDRYDILIRPIEKNILSKIRTKLIPSAKGDVLEIGCGTGVNFSYYNRNSVRSLSALDLHIKPQARERVCFPTTFIEGRAENLPFPDNCFDTVVETLVLCCVKNLPASINEILRVLKPGGIFIFLDHEKPPEKGLAFLFRAVDSFWPRIAGGCHLTREPHKLIEISDFRIEKSGTAGREIFHWGIGRKLNPANCHRPKSVACRATDKVLE